MLPGRVDQGHAGQLAAGDADLDRRHRADVLGPGGPQGQPGGRGRRPGRTAPDVAVLTARRSDRWRCVVVPAPPVVAVVAAVFGAAGGSAAGHSHRGGERNTQPEQYRRRQRARATEILPTAVRPQRCGRASHSVPHRAPAHGCSRDAAPVRCRTSWPGASGGAVPGRCTASGRPSSGGWRWGKLDAVPVLRVALAQIDLTVGDIAGNCRRIVAAAGEAARAGADLVALPEMAITGYPPEDLVFRASFRQASRAALDRLAADLDAAGLGDLAVVVGYLDDDPARPAGRPGRRRRSTGPARRPGPKAGPVRRAGQHGSMRSRTAAGRPAHEARATRPRSSSAARWWPATTSTTCPTTASSTRTATSSRASSSRWSASAAWTSP